MQACFQPAFDAWFEEYVDRMTWRDGRTHKPPQTHKCVKTGLLPGYEGQKTNHLWCEIWTRLQLWSKGCCWHDTDCKHQIFLFQRNQNVAPIKFAQWANVDKCLFNLSVKFSLMTCSLYFPPTCLTLPHSICLHLQWPLSVKVQKQWKSLVSVSLHHVLTIQP